MDGGTWPYASQAGPRQPAVLGFEHEARIELPAGALDTVNMAALPDVIHEALVQLSPLAGAASDIEVVRARPGSTRGERRTR